MQLQRLFTIVNTLARHRIDTLLPVSKINWVIRSFTLFQPAAWKNNHYDTRGQRLRLALETLGTIFVKFGQTLSTRPDILPDDIVIELSKLQDKVPPFSSALALQLIQTAYGKPATAIFKDFSITPLASASVAQVHAATLPDGSTVVVKIVRPNIKKLITHDIKLLYFLARCLVRYWPEAKRLRLHEVIAEFEKIIYYELDMQREAANASQLRRNFNDSPLLYVPQIYWDYCRANILVMERIYGVKIVDLTLLRARNTDLKKLAERGVEIFYTQVFRDKFFHADMHPGNVFVDITDPQDPKYLGIDFGIMGTLNDEDQYYLAQNFLAFFKRDYRKVAQLHVDSGWVPATTRVDELESGIRTVCEPIFNKPLSDISFAAVLINLFQVARQFDMEVQPQLVLLQKTLLNIEGLGRQLYPTLNLWETAKPFLESMMRKQLGIRGVLKKVQDYYPMWLHKFPELPILIIDKLERSSRRELQLTHLQAALLKSKQQQREFRQKTVLLTILAIGLFVLEKFL